MPRLVCIFAHEGPREPGGRGAMNGLQHLHSNALKQDSMHGAVFDVSGKADLMLLLRRWHQCCDPVVREGRSLQLSEPGDPGG